MLAAGVYARAPIAGPPPARAHSQQSPLAEQAPLIGAQVGGVSMHTPAASSHVCVARHPGLHCRTPPQPSASKPHWRYEHCVSGVQSCEPGVRHCAPSLEQVAPALHAPHSYSPPLRGLVRGGAVGSESSKKTCGGGAGRQWRRAGVLHGRVEVYAQTRGGFAGEQGAAATAALAYVLRRNARTTHQPPRHRSSRRRPSALASACTPACRQHTRCRRGRRSPRGRRLSLSPGWCTPGNRRTCKGGVGEACARGRWRAPARDGTAAAGGRALPARGPSSFTRAHAGQRARAHPSLCTPLRGEGLRQVAAFR